MNFFSMLPKDTCITILPHDIVDVDAAISAILLSKLLDFYNVPNEIAIFDDSVDKCTEHFLKKLSYDLSKFFVKNEDKTRKLFLVDHYKTSHEGMVIGCIDHHFTSEEIKYDYYLYKPSCSAAYMVYNLMKKAGMQITKEVACLVGIASMVDTCSFKSTKAVLEEKEEILSLLKNYCFDIKEMLYECLCLNNLSMMTLDEIAQNGKKEYNYSGNIVKSSYVQINSLEIPNEVIQYVSKLVENEKLDMWVFIVFDLVNEKTRVYKITSNQVKIEKYDKIVSRGKDIMPQVEKDFG